MARSLANLKLERDAIVLYESLAAIEKDPRRAAAFGRIAAMPRSGPTSCAMPAPACRPSAVQGCGSG